MLPFIMASWTVVQNISFYCCKFWILPLWQHMAMSYHIGAATLAKPFTLFFNFCISFQHFTFALLTFLTSVRYVISLLWWFSCFKCSFAPFLVVSSTQAKVMVLYLIFAT